MNENDGLYFFLTCIFIFEHLDSREACNEDLCLSPECIHSASTVLKNMDPDVEPCDNFYRFACGGYIKSTVLPDGKDALQNINIVKDKVQIDLRTIMEAPIEPDERKPFRLVKNLFTVCMNTTAIEEQGLEPLHRRLKKLGGWPVVDGEEWNEGDFDWIRSIYKFHNAGCEIDQFIGLEVRGDLTNSTSRVIYLEQASLGIPRDYLVMGPDTNVTKAYHDHMVDIAVLLGADKERASIELKESLLFEINLANITLSLEERFNVDNINMTYIEMTVAELMTNFPSIPWKEYFSELLPKTITVDENQVLRVIRQSFISELEKLISETPKRVQANYALWRVVSSSLSWLNDDVHNRQRDFQSIMYRKQELDPKWKQCVSLVDNHLVLGLSAMYVRKHFDEESKRKTVDMVENIKQRFIEILEEAEWIDEETRGVALEKASSIISHIAYPDELLDDNKLEEIYANLELSGENYLESIGNLTLFAAENSYGKLNEPVTRNEWRPHRRATVVNAFYSMFENSITFPAAILQGALFNKNRPAYMNYGAIGFVIGHEISHAYDDFARKLDKDGNFKELWTPSSVERYLEKTQCLINQYGNYTVEEVGLNLNGAKSLRESFSDNGGIKIARRAYINWLERNAPEQKLPGLPYSPKQMFWMSTANMWCEKMNPEKLRSFIITNRHSPGEVRVLLPLSNMPEFSEDFNCPIGSKMNPEDKCSVW